MSAPRGIAAPGNGAAIGPVRRPCDDRDHALARRLHGAGLAAPALLWLAGLRPLSFLGGQCLRMVEPLWGAVSENETLQHLIDVLEDRERTAHLLDLLESASESNGEPSP